MRLHSTLRVASLCTILATLALACTSATHATPPALSVVSGLAGGQPDDSFVESLNPTSTQKIGSNTLILLNNVNYPPEPILADLIMSNVLGADTGRLGIVRASRDEFSDIAVGIGLGDPIHTLHLHNGPLTPFGFTPRPVTLALTNDVTGKSASDGLEMAIDVDGSAALNQLEDLPLSLSTNGVRRLTIDGSGAIGIGTDAPQAKLHVAGNSGVDGIMFPDGTVQTTAAFPGSAIPVGLISMWSGPIANIPAGWSLCDGSNGTPNLSDRFIVSVGDGYMVGDLGGENAHTLSIAEMPSHHHSYQHHPTEKFSGSSETAGKGPLQNFDTGDEGGGQPHENRPPFYALAFIMKL